MNKAFTLVELSIVLVIIGLLAGGVLVGQELIEAAEIKNTIIQKEEYEAAVLTFKVKYAALPGDIPNASDFGFSADSNGNGDEEIGVCQHCGGNTSNYGSDTKESYNFWYHLSAAELIAGEFPAMGLTVNDSASYTAAAANPLPEVKITSASKGVYEERATFRVFPGMRFGIDARFPINDIGTGGGEWPKHSLMIGTGPAQVYMQGGLLARHAGAIDLKMDDGYAFEGKARLFSYLWSAIPFPEQRCEGYWNCATDFHFCANRSVTPFAYNMDKEGADCGLIFKAPF